MKKLKFDVSKRVEELFIYLADNFDKSASPNPKVFLKSKNIEELNSDEKSDLFLLLDFAGWDVADYEIMGQKWKMITYKIKGVK
jgi:hypothetical protein